MYEFKRVLEKNKTKKKVPDISLNSHFSIRTVQRWDLSGKKKTFPFLRCSGMNMPNENTTKSQLLLKRSTWGLMKHPDFLNSSNKISSA